MAILITGGTGYIGSHACLELIRAGRQVVALDNLSNSRRAALTRVEGMVGRSIPFHQVDIRDRAGLEGVFRAHEIDSVMHFAGLKAVGESVGQPLRYYDNNINGTLVLLEVMRAAGVRSMVFSSSATVYGDPKRVPVTEDFPLAATNPYGRSKLFIEDMLRDLVRAEPGWDIALLRYFNPTGADESGLIGEDPNGIPNNLVPYVAQVAVGKHDKVAVYGGDYPTRDGTGIRDYIHVTDLVIGHLRALEKLASHPGLVTYNLGTGRGYSVLEMLAAFARAVGRPIPHEIVARRPGDAAECWSDATKAKTELGWVAVRDLDVMCADVWRWQSRNPAGFA
ncbi:MAG: UDP-glucose 4-epimerase GalE [Gemmatimonadetes bacterium]|nr:UDP-glucose 4-epimerase GalE [Gemmatimonadota bacterium]